MKISDYIAEKIYESDVKIMFGYTGGSISDIIDSIYKLKNIRIVQNYHEQATAFAANGYSLVLQKTAVAISSSGPGAVNLIGGIANAFYDSIPCVFITGNCHTLGAKESVHIRQNAFQETDIVSLVKSITKFSHRIDNPNQIRYYLEKAFFMANEGRKGPVLLDIPYDIARSDLNIALLDGFDKTKLEYSSINTREIVEILSQAKKPLIILGGGAKGSLCRAKLQTLLGKIKIPVVSSLCGLDVLPHNHECFLGFIGHYGNRYANLALVNCDCLIVIGSRLDERQLCYKTKLNSNLKVIRVDIDEYELNRKINVTVSIHSTAENFLEQLAETSFEKCNFEKWLKIVFGWKKRYPSYDFSLNEVNANNFLQVISGYLSHNAVICSDVGQNQMCVAQSLQLDDQRRLLNSAGYGSMGFSLPAAIGAAYARENTMILSVNGDGGMQMNIQELQTIKRDNLPINVVVLNNNCLGMIRRLQENMFDNRTVASVEGYSAPDYEQIAKAYGIDYLKVDCISKYGLVKDFISSKHPTFIEVVLPQIMQNNPDPGESLDKQIPLLSDEEYKVIKRECCFES